MNKLTFVAHIMSCSGPCGPQWNATLEGYPTGSRLDNTIRIEWSGDHPCPITPSTGDRRFRVTIEEIVPKTKVVPWKAEEVPMPCYIRWKGQTTVRYSLTMVADNGVYCCGTSWGFCQFAEHYEHSTDGGKTWLPCGRVEEVIE